MYRLIIALFALFLLLPNAQAMEFKIATLAPDGSHWMNAMREGAREIEKRTEGRVSFRFYPGGVMGNDRSVLRRIRVGQLHGGAITGGGLAEVLPETNVYSIPFLFRDYDEVDYVREQMDPVLIEALADSGYISFGISEGGFAYLLSNSEIGGIADLGNTKVWIPEGDEISRIAFEASGVSPIPLPLTDVLTGLQTGLIDTVAGSPSGVIALQWHTRVRHLTDVPLAYLFGSLVIQKRIFERLSKPDQAVVHEVMGAIFRDLDRGMRSDNQQALAALKSQGINFVPTQEDAMDKWRELVDRAIQQRIDGGLFKPAIMQQLRGHLSDYRTRTQTP